MAAERRTQAERRDETRRRILDAALQTFARDGVNASVATIAAQAGCSTGAIYTHFSGKRDLILAVFDEGFGAWARGYLTVDSPVDGTVDAAVTRWRKLLDTNPDQTRLYLEFWLAAQRDSDLAEPFRQRQGEIIATVTDLVEQQWAEQGITPPVPAAALGAVITALADGLSLQYLAGTTPDADDLFRTVLHVLTAALRAS